MLTEQLNSYCNEAGTVLAAVRGEILLCRNDPGRQLAAGPMASRIEQLLSEAEAAGVFHELNELRHRLIAHTGPVVSDEFARSVLDLIARAESRIAVTRIVEQEIPSHLDELLDSALGSPGPEEIVFEPVEAEPDPRDSLEADRELMSIFAAEAEELLSCIDSGIERLAARSDDTEALWAVRRAAHTFKGSSGIVGLDGPSRLAHRIEDLLDRLSESRTAPDPALIPLLAAASGLIRSMLTEEYPDRLDAELRRIHAQFDELSGPASRPPSVPAKARPGNDPAAKAVEPRRSVRVSLDELDALVSLSRELVLNRSVLSVKVAELDRELDELHNLARHLRSLNGRLEVDISSMMLEQRRPAGSIVPVYSRQDPAFGQPDQFDALELDRYSEFHEAIRDLAEAATDTAEIDRSIEAIKDEIDGLVREQRRIAGELRSRLVSIRLIPFETLRARLERTARATCMEIGKQAEFILDGHGKLVDAQILDALAEPLLHLIKNAAVHGIETAETRRLIGKPDTGRISVSVRNNETHLIVEVTDDGRGLDLTELKQRAVALGRIDRSAAEQLTEEEAVKLVFVTGISTARQIDLNAGRGVGMGIVKQSIEAVDGAVSLATTPHFGTTVTIRIPLKLAISNSIVASCSVGTYAVPIRQIEKVVEAARDEVERSPDGYVLRYAGQSLRLVTLEQALGKNGPEFSELNFITAMIVKDCGEPTAIAVRSVHRTEEVVVKPLPRGLGEIHEVLGIAQLSTGELAPVLDLRRLASSARPAARPKAGPFARPLSVLIVDDSPSVRHMTSTVVRNAGWEAITASDGIDALESLTRAYRLPDVILTDIEMPRCGGFELAAAIAKDPRLSSIPVVVVTSRTAEKHREKAGTAGVAAYLVKPYDEKALVELIQQLKRDS